MSKKIKIIFTIEYEIDGDNLTDEEIRDRMFEHFSPNGNVIIIDENSIILLNSVEQELGDLEHDNNTH